MTPSQFRACASRSQIPGVVEAANRGRSMQLLLAGTFALSWLFGATAWAACSEVEHALKQMHNSQDAGTISKLLGLATPKTCGEALQLDGVAVHCSWQFEFRERAAKTAFEHIADRLGTCFPFEPDAGVNHPDTHNSRIYVTNGAKVVVSIKDKSALNSTFVFLKVGKGIS